MTELSRLVPDNCQWWTSVTFDDSGVCERTIRVSQRHAQQIASLVGESLSYQEAIRMLLSQGVWSLRRSDYEIDCIEITEDWDWESTTKPNAVWFDAIDWDEEGEEFARKVEFTRGQLLDLAEVAPNAKNVAEAVRLVVNQALSERMG